MNRLERIVAVTLALTGAGAIVGALAGAAALTFSLLVTSEPRPAAGLIMGAFLGAPIGAVTAPALAWLLLRRVPLGRMFMECSVGTTIGGVIGWVTAASVMAPVGGLAGAFTGCVVAGVLLRHRLGA